MDFYETGQVDEHHYVLFLQNAWSSTWAGKIWPRASWLDAFGKSRSGIRIQELTQDLQFVPHNTTLEVAGVSTGVCRPNSDHIKAILDQGPRGVICCGSQALKSVAPLWRGPLLGVPHPGYRLLTNELYWRGYDLLDAGLDRVGMNEGGWPTRFILKQRKGSVETSVLD